jgi:hypothetical protein
LEEKNTGVSGVPVTDSGVTGSQDSSSVSPNTTEAQTPAKPFGHDAPASDASPGTGDRRIPYDRFKEVYDKMKGYEAQIQSQPGTPVQQQGAVPDAIDDEISRWTKIAEESFDDPRKSVEAADNIAKLRATQISGQALQGLMQEQARASAVQQFDMQKQQAWVQALTEYPELNNPQSDFYKESEAEYLSDPGLQELSSGMLRAAESTFARLARSGGAPSSSQRLEGGVRPAPQTTPQAEEAADRAGIQPGDQNSLLRYLEKHQPWKDSR